MVLSIHVQTWLYVLFGGSHSGKRDSYYGRKFEHIRRHNVINFDDISNFYEIFICIQNIATQALMAKSGFSCKLNRWLIKALTTQWKIDLERFNCFAYGPFGFAAMLCLQHTCYYWLFELISETRLSICILFIDNK